MQEDFHYYATYCAAYIAGYSHEECLEICYSAQLPDWFSKSYLAKIHGPLTAATTQLPLEMANARTDIIGLQDITRIWASFHFLPKDLYAKVNKGTKRYRDKYRLICGPNGQLVVDTVNLAKGGSPQAIGLAMHVLADTWAHYNFAGTPSLVINNVNRHFYQIINTDDGTTRKAVTFKHNPAAPDDLDTGSFTNTLYQANESSIMNLGHGRAGHFPDYSFARYAYLPAWDNYEETIKDNPSDYYHAFCQMVYAMGYLRGKSDTFELDTYAFDAVKPWKDTIHNILIKRQLSACDEWKRFGESLSGHTIEDFDLEKHQEQYLSANDSQKDKTVLGRFIIASLAHKSMVTNRIYASGNTLAGRSIDYSKKGFGGIKDYLMLLKERGIKNE